MRKQPFRGAILNLRLEKEDLDWRFILRPAEEDPALLRRIAARLIEMAWALEVGASEGER